MADLVFGNNPTKKYSKEFKEYLINQLKISAQTIIDNAEEIIGNHKYSGELNININMCTSGETHFPSITINKEWFPDCKKLSEIYDKMHEEEVKKDTNIVKRSFRECQKDIYKGIVGDIQV